VRNRTQFKRIESRWWIRRMLRCNTMKIRNI
jgi:hypothetical protein